MHASCMEQVFKYWSGYLVKEGRLKILGYWAMEGVREVIAFAFWRLVGLPT